MMVKDCWRGVLAVSACALLAGCGWFGRDDATPHVKARPGADRLVAPTATLPPAPPGHGADQGVAPVDETRSSSPQIGSLFPAGRAAGAEGSRRQRPPSRRQGARCTDAAERRPRPNSKRYQVRTTPTQPPPAEAPAAPEPAPATRSPPAALLDDRGRPIGEDANTVAIGFCDPVATAPGSLGAEPGSRVISGGRTMGPSTWRRRSGRARSRPR